MMERMDKILPDGRANTEARIFAIGDIHGCLGKLEALLARLSPAEGDTLVFLGDYVNRGPDSRGVIDFLLGLADRTRAVFLCGNHEHALLEYARTGDVEYLRLLRSLGVEATLGSYGCSAMSALRDLSFMPHQHREFLEELQAFHREGGYLFAHAGLAEPEDGLHDALDRQLSARGVFFASPRTGAEVIVFGHTAFETPFVATDRIGIDTGAVYGNVLTAVELPALRFHHA